MTVLLKNVLMKQEELLINLDPSAQVFVVLCVTEWEFPELLLHTEV